MYDLWRADGTKREGIEKDVFSGIAILNGTSWAENCGEVMRFLAGGMAFTNSWVEDSAPEASASLSFLPFTYCPSVRATIRRLV
jgi:hypothetical protein